jgi:PPIC-type PPIASE domain
MNRTALIAALLLLTTTVVSAQEARKPIQLPDDVAAIVHDKFISMAEFREVLVRRFAKTEEGKKALNNLVEAQLVTREKEIRGIRISDDELKAYIAKVEKDVIRSTAGTRTLDEVLKEKETTRAQLMEASRDFLARQRMAQADTGITTDLSPQALGVWLEDLKKKRGVVVDGPGVPAGALALVGDRVVTKKEFGLELVKHLPPSRLEGALWDLAIAVSVERIMKERGVKIETPDIDRAVEDLKAEFKEDPRFRQTTFTFEQYVEAARHMTVAELRKDALFLAQVGLAKIVRAGLTVADIRKKWEENRDLYGERRVFIHLLIRADDRPSTPFGGASRSYRKAREIIDAVYNRYLRGTPFEKLVVEASEDRDKFKRPDRHIEVTRASPLPETWKKAVFSAPAGDVLGPIRSPFGYHLIKVIEIKPAPGFEAAREKVLRDLVREGRTTALLEIRQDPLIVLRY